MEFSKIKKFPVLFALAFTLISSLIMSPSTFADVSPGPNGEYCTIISISGSGGTSGGSYNTTPDRPQYVSRSLTDGTDVLGNPGGMPVILKYKEGCQSYNFASCEVDSKGNLNYATIHYCPLKAVTPKASQCSNTTQYAQVPANWFAEGKTYALFSYGAFPGLGSCPSSSAYIYMCN